MISFPFGRYQISSDIGKEPPTKTTAAAMAELGRTVSGTPNATFMVSPHGLGWYVSTAEIAPDSSWKQSHPRALAKLELTATEVTLAGDGSVTSGQGIYHQRWLEVITKSPVADYGWGDGEIPEPDIVLRIEHVKLCETRVFIIYRVAEAAITVGALESKLPRPYPITRNINQFMYQAINSSIVQPKP